MGRRFDPAKFARLEDPARFGWQHPDAVVELLGLTGVETVVHPGGLNEALNEILPKSPGPTLIVMADLPLTPPANITESVSTKARMAMVPGRGGGTNAIYLPNPAGFRTEFYGVSFLKHLEIAGDLGFSVEIIDSFRLHDDIDEVEDLVEVLTLGSGGTRRYLERLGFSLSTENGRVGVKRNPHEQALVRGD